LPISTGWPERVEEKERIRAEALSLGFSKAGFTTPERIRGDFLLHWLENGAEAGMAYMRRNIELRLEPEKLFPPVKTIISLAVNYFPGELKYAGPKISRYAVGKDYHRVLKKMMKRLFTFIRTLFPDVQARFFVDSAPVLEREIARRAGIGWIGKNTMLITKEYGSWVFLGEMFISVELPPDSPVQTGYCGTCTACIDACPTGALKPYFLDSRLCLSYITVEHKGEIPEVYKDKNHGWLFGCDICQEVCPWNARVRKTTMEEFLPGPQILLLKRKELLSLSREKFDEIFRGTPVKRAGFEKLKELARYCIPK